jgi:L-arabinose transport system ATP-binding protein
MEPPKPYLEFRKVSKQFPGVRALDEVSFDVPAGHVRALIGENGAGKSTLLKILSGAQAPSSGGVLVDGTEVTTFSPAHALSAGIAVIYQELHLVPEMTVAENLYLGHLPLKRGLVDRVRLEAAARAKLEELGEDIPPRMKLGRLPIAQRQMVEIAKALTRGAKVIAFDEPTSSLSKREVERLMQTIGRLRARGHVILYVSHRMEEIFEVADSVTVLRDGKLVETFPTLEGVTHDILVRRMVGRSIEDIYGFTARPHGGPALEVRGLHGPHLEAPACLTVAKGEIVGLFGLVGAGRSELLRLIYGADRPRGGEVLISGERVSIRSPRDGIRHGLAYCPEDRKKDGVIPVRSVMENMNLTARREHLRFGILNQRWEKENAQTQAARLRVKTPSLHQTIGKLSGGNQQKVIFGRWLSGDIRVILLDEPTRGIDVGAKREIYSIIYRLAESGMGVLLVSSDLPEVLGVADRIVVMREGEIAGQLQREEASSDKVMKLALPISGERVAERGNH